MTRMLYYANLFIRTINSKLIKYFSSNSLCKVTPLKVDAIKIVRYDFDNLCNLRQYSHMDELRNQLKIMNCQFGFYT